ncbi:MAG: hypothetical protein JW818_19310, partial [Pirellulales bacterium]|nr:hypothetical protein [Pirellulales bacterium]
MEPLWVSILVGFIAMAEGQGNGPMAVSPSLGEPLCRLGAERYWHDARISALAMQPGGNLAACAGGNGSIDLVSDSLKLRSRTTGAGEVVCLAFSPEGKRLLSINSAGVVRLWEVEQAGTLHALWHVPWPAKLPRHRARDIAARFTPNGASILLTDSMRTGWVLNATDGRQVHKVADSRGRLAAFSADGRSLLVATVDNRLRTWQWATDKPVAEVELAWPGLRLEATDPRDDTLMNQFVASPDGKTFLLGTKYSLMAGDLASGKLLGKVARREPRRHPDAPHVAFSSDGKELAVAWATWSGPLVEVCRWPGGKTLWTSPLACEPTGPVTFGHDNKRLLTADGWTVRLWGLSRGGLPRGDEIEPLEGHADAMVAVLFSPDGSRVATVGQDCRVGLWESRTGRLESMTRLGSRQPSSGSVAFSPDGKR